MDILFTPSFTWPEIIGGLIFLGLGFAWTEEENGVYFTCAAILFTIVLLGFFFGEILVAMVEPKGSVENSMRRPTIIYGIGFILGAILGRMLQPIVWRMKSYVRLSPKQRWRRN